MKRRDHIKTLLIGAIAGASVGTTVSCQSDAKSTPEVATTTNPNGLYGRLPKEIERDQSLQKEVYFNEEELAAIAILCDIILPANESAGSATDAEVPAFIEFIVKDLPYHQLPLRGGLMWLEGEFNKRYGKTFVEGSDEEQVALIDDIAYPEKGTENPALQPGIKFFNLIRNLTVTGYYTTRIGLDDLGYTGNYANVWDGVPDEILKDHDVSYEPEWLDKCIDQSKRNEIAKWDEQGNLLT